LVQFRAFNLLSDIYEIRPEVDVVFLRNVMIYFDRDAQRQILRRMRQLIRPDGLLIIGHSENLFHCSDLFRSLGQTVYQPVGSR
ncbi:MAG: CheR family methyltransferase, partial [Oceanococcaceae bacterium]